jgi:hypothetical protein
MALAMGLLSLKSNPILWNFGRNPLGLGLLNWK